MKIQDVFFITIFSALAIVAVILLGISDILGILLTGCIGGLIAALAAGRRKAYGREAAGKWKSIFLCSGISALNISLVLISKVYIWNVITGITGSPYDMYQINYLRVFLLTGALSFFSLVATLAIHDHSHVFGLDPVEKN